MKYDYYSFITNYCLFFSVSLIVNSVFYFTGRASVDTVLINLLTMSVVTLFLAAILNVFINVKNLYSSLEEIKKKSKLVNVKRQYHQVRFKKFRGGR